MSLTQLTPKTPSQLGGRDYTEKQQSFLTALADTFNVDAAAKIAGYSNSGKLKAVKSLKEEILQLTQSYLASNAPKAAKQLVDTLEGTAQKEEFYSSKYKAGIELLDRVGIGKHSTVEVSGQIQHAVILLPAKKELKAVN